MNFWESSGKTKLICLSCHCPAGLVSLSLMLSNMILLTASSSPCAGEFKCEESTCLSLYSFCASIWNCYCWEMGSINRALTDEVKCPFLFSFNISFEVMLSCPGVSEICKYNMSAWFFIVPLQCSNIRLQLLTGIEGYLHRLLQVPGILSVCINTLITEFTGCIK